jgi:hypothetical protein
MSDDLSTLQQMLRDRAAEVPQRQEPPRTMLARSRRRLVRNAVTTVAVAGVLIVGASAGLANLGALGGSNNQVPGGSPSSPVASGSACAAADLRATARLDGAAGSVEGSIELANLGGGTCTLTGRPGVTLSSSSGRDLSVNVEPVPPQWQADGAARPDGWPVVSLRPGSAASIRVRWTNACPQLSNPALWRVDLGGGRGTLEVQGADATFPPPCNGPAEPSTLEVGPFEPGGAA